MMRQVIQIGDKIKQKQVENTEALHSHISNSGVESFQQESLLVGQKQKFVLSDEERKMAADVNFHEEVINQRKEDINKIGDIMANINEMARDLAIETSEQGNKLGRLDQNMAEADNNAEEALDQLKKGRKNQKSAGKCMKCLIAIIILALIAVGLIIYFNFIKN